MSTIDLEATVYLLIGSNIQPDKYVRLAIARLREHFSVQSISSVYRSPAFGPLQNQPDFLNVALKISTAQTPIMVKRRLLDIEAELGRDRSKQKSAFDARTVDIDIMLWNDDAFEFGNRPWQIPDENILKQAATALPLAEIAPHYVHPQTGQTLKEIARQFDRAHVTHIDIEL